MEDIRINEIWHLYHMVLEQNATVKLVESKDNRYVVKTTVPDGTSFLFVLTPQHEYTGGVNKPYAMSVVKKRKISRKALHMLSHNLKSRPIKIKGQK